MNKIFYLEDVPNPFEIINMFQIKGEMEKKLRSSIEKPDVRKEIREIFENDPLYHFEYDFVKAIDEIKDNIDEYSHFIIDRNLTGYDDYDGHDVAYDYAIATEKLGHKPKATREGDEIVHKIFNVYLNNDNINELPSSIRFLTANDNLKDGPKLQEDKLHAFFNTDKGQFCLVRKGDTGYRREIYNFIFNKEETRIINLHDSLFKLIENCWDDKKDKKVIKAALINTYKYLALKEEDQKKVEKPKIREIITKIARKIDPHPLSDPSKTWKSINYLIRKINAVIDHKTGRINKEYVNWFNSIDFKRKDFKLDEFVDDSTAMFNLSYYIYYQTSKREHGELTFDLNFNTAVYGTIDVLNWYAKYNNKSR